MLGRFLLVLTTLACAACGPSVGTQPKLPAADHRRSVAPAVSWAQETWSPQPLNAAPPPGLEAIYAACGVADQALARVAARVLELDRAGVKLDDTSLKLALRVEGVPYVWPRRWQTELPNPKAAQGVQAWQARYSKAGVSRCGVALFQEGAGHPRLSVVAADSEVNLEPLPIRVRVGQWLTFAARVHGASEPALFLQGPRGRPRQALVALHGEDLKARFALSEPGLWTLQLIANAPTGPLPLAEALIFADIEPSQDLQWPAAPGEAEDNEALSDNQRLLAMLNSARASEKLLALKQRSDLSAIAQAHAEAMRDAETLAHDLGQGGAAERIVAAGISEQFSLIGENVAAALSTPRAHRLLWSSPAHRFTLLRPDFDSVGIGTARGGDGRIWVCQLFARTK